MSFRVNSCMPFTVYYNQNEVQTIYYNNNLVWDKSNLDWSEGISWADLYSLCKQRQAGTIDAFPNIVQLGLKMEMPYGVKVRLIDIESEGPGILIFQQYQTGTYVGGLMYHKDVMEKYYPSIYPYIKPLYKPKYSIYANTGVTETSELCYVWELSVLEIDEKAQSYNVSFPNGTTFSINTDYTVGTKVKYPYLFEESNRICFNQNGISVAYPLRSYDTWNSKSWDRFYIANFSANTSSGEIVSKSQITYNNYQFPCFAIG